jgi:uncharacterized protein Yka (UPF0111/DUF47 family)
MTLTIVCNNAFRGNFGSLAKKNDFKFPNEKIQSTHSKMEKHYKLVTSTFSDLQKRRMERLRKYITVFQEEIKEIDSISREIIDVLKKDSEALEKELESNSETNDKEVGTDIIKREHDQYFE